MKHYVVLDFEMCEVSKGLRNRSYNRAHEIIQLGAVLLNEEYDIIGEFNRFVKPQYGKLDSFIRRLTGITWEDIINAPMLEQVINDFTEWIPEGEVELVAWSDNDKNQLYGEIALKGIINKRIDDLRYCWIDSQKIYSERINNMRCFSLEEALIACDIKAIGRAHDGLSDAYNTGLLFKKLMTEEELEFNKIYVESKSEEIIHLTSSLGDLFAGLGFAECVAV